jgi:hypothetical protein
MCVFGQRAKKSSFVAALVSKKRAHCKDARRALGMVLLRKLKWVNKDVIRSCILPRVWETRLQNVWVDRDYSNPGGVGVKKQKV